MWKIKDIEIKSHVVLGPMAGVTFLSYRDFMKPFGVGLSVTEMVSDCGLIYGNKTTLEYIETSNVDHPCAIQLFGSDADNICKAMDIVIKENPNFEMFDINLGCPVPKVVKTGAGSALLKDPKKLYEYMKKICDHSPKPVTAKIRLGWDDKSINFMENIEALEKAGVAAIAIHARTTKQMYTGKPRYELLKDLGNKMSVPLIVSGDIFTLEDAIAARELTKATAVMVARGGIGNPYLVTQINHYIETGEKLEPQSLKENIDNLLRLTDMMIEEKGEQKAMMILRGIAPKFFTAMPGAKKLKSELAQGLVTKDSMIKIIDKYLSSNKDMD
jgi:nifR3 family TIM-barrel protein